jgi:hypothetical protein
MDLILWILIELVLIVFILACYWIVFRKAGKPGWAAIIPIYNYVVLCQVAGYSGWLALLMFVPIVNIIVVFFICLGMAKKFGQDTLFGILMFFFFPILMAVIAFSKSIQYGNVVANN